MGIRDWFRRKPALWQPESDADDQWSPVKRGWGAGQRKGPIRAALRNTHHPVGVQHQNRAGHREHVRTLQTRQVRMNIVGFGKWRKHKARDEESHALDSADPFNIVIARRELRPDNVIGDRLARHELRRQRKVENRRLVGHDDH